MAGLPRVRRAPGGHGARRPRSSATAARRPSWRPGTGPARPDRRPPRAPAWASTSTTTRQRFSRRLAAERRRDPPGRDRGRAAGPRSTRRWPPSRRAFRRRAPGPGPRPRPRARSAPGRRAGRAAGRGRRRGARRGHRSLFIGGLGRSGSHAARADARPGSPTSASVGELVHLWERGLRDERALRLRRARSADCPFWQRGSARSPSAAGTSSTSSEVLALKAAVDRNRYVPRMVLPGCPRRLPGPPARATATCCSRLYAAVRRGHRATAWWSTPASTPPTPSCVRRLPASTCAGAAPGPRQPRGGLLLDQADARGPRSSPATPSWPPTPRCASSAPLDLGYNLLFDLLGRARACRASCCATRIAGPRPAGRARAACSAPRPAARGRRRARLRRRRLRRARPQPHRGRQPDALHAAAGSPLRRRRGVAGPAAPPRTACSPPVLDLAAAAGATATCGTAADGR